MTNRELISQYIKGNKRAGATNHLGFIGNELVNYSTTICVIDRANKCARVNKRKYSTTTSKIQNMLAYELNIAGYEVEEYQGEPCHYWNWGYQGAENVTIKDVAECVNITAII